MPALHVWSNRWSCDVGAVAGQDLYPAHGQAYVARLTPASSDGWVPALHVQTAPAPKHRQRDDLGVDRLGVGLSTPPTKNIKNRTVYLGLLSCFAET